MVSYDIIKEKIDKIITSEKTTTFLNASSSLGYCIGNGAENTNNFIDKVFNNEEDVIVEKTNSNRSINSLSILNKRLIIKTLSIRSYRFLIKNFKNSDRNNINIEFILNQIKEKLNSYDYFLIILTERNRKNQPFRINYKFYLIPINRFLISNDYEEKTYGIFSKYWTLLNFKDFYFKFNKEFLKNYYFYEYNWQ